MTMTRGEHDEAYHISEVSRRGAHRPRGNPLVGLLPMAALAVLVIGVVALAYVLFGRGGDAGSSAEPVTAASGVGTPSPAASASTEAQPSATVSASAEAVASPTPSATSSAQASVDTSTVLDFYNGSSPNVPGLSRKAAAELKAAGWPIGVIQTWNGAAVSRTTVYYRDASQLATARAVIRQLGVGVAKVNTRYATTGLTVVISNDYTP